MCFGRGSTKDDLTSYSPPSVCEQSGSKTVVKMILVIFLYYYFVFARAELEVMKISAFESPSQEEIINPHFQNPKTNETIRFKKSFANASNKFYQPQFAIASNFTKIKMNLTANVSSLEKKNNVHKKEGLSILEGVQDYIRTGVFKNYLMAPIEPTTYRYPIAVWSSQTYENLKSNQKVRPKSSFYRVPLNTAYSHIGRGRNFTLERTERRNRGKTKWKDFDLSEQLTSDDYGGLSKVNKDYFVDKFLEQSLNKYLTSSNLKDVVGNVSVKTFSEILKNITDQKPRRSQSPYDENKELRMKFREEVILKKRNDTTKPQGRFLEKQLQKRLEKVQGVFNEKNKDKILANMWKYATLNRTADTSEEKKNKTEDYVAITMTSSVETTTPDFFNYDATHLTTKNLAAESRFSPKHIRGTVKYQRIKYTSTEKIGDYESVSDERDRRNSIKLTAQESSYYRKGQFPNLTFIGHPGKY